MFGSGAVREGFEPSVQFNPYDGLANRSFRPLRHLTELTFLKGGKNKGIYNYLQNLKAFFFWITSIIILRGADSVHSWIESIQAEVCDANDVK